MAAAGAGLGVGLFERREVGKREGRWRGELFFFFFFPLAMAVSVFFFLAPFEPPSSFSLSLFLCSWFEYAIFLSSQSSKRRRKKIEQRRTAGEEGAFSERTFSRVWQLLNFKFWFHPFSLQVQLTLATASLRA